MLRDGCRMERAPLRQHVRTAGDLALDRGVEDDSDTS